MYGSQPKLSSVVESSLTWDLFLGFYSQDFDLRQQSQWSLEKAAKIWGRHHWFLPKMTFGSDCRNFILATSCVTTQCFWLQFSLGSRPIRSTTQNWVLAPQQYEISAVISQTSFHRETSDGVEKCRLFSQAIWRLFSSVDARLRCSWV